MLRHEDDEGESASDAEENRKRSLPDRDARTDIPGEVSSPSVVDTTAQGEREAKRSRSSPQVDERQLVEPPNVAQVAALPREQVDPAVNQRAFTGQQIGAQSQLDSYQRYLQLTSDAGSLSRLVAQQHQQASAGQGTWGNNPAMPSGLGNALYMGHQQQPPELAQYLQLQALGHPLPYAIAGLAQPQVRFGYGATQAMDPYIQAQLAAARLNQPNLAAARIPGGQQDQPQATRAGLHGLGVGMYGGLGLAAAYGQQQNPMLAMQARGVVGAQLGGIPLSLPAPLALPEDNLKLSNHQILLRHQIEAFQATEDDLTTHTRGRNKPITLGQVGIRCRHCAHLPVAQRQKGSTYFPATLLGLYQAAQNMSTTHMQCGLCTEMPNEIKQQFVILLSSKTASSGAGRPYWADAAKKLGLVDTDDGIRFIRDIPPGVKITEDEERTS